MRKLQELRERLKAKSDVLAKAFEEGGPELDSSKIKCLGGVNEGMKTSQDKTQKMKALNDELTDIGKEITKELEENGDPEVIKAQNERLQKSLNSGVNRLPIPEAEKKAEGGRIIQTKSFGQMVVESEAYIGRSQEKEAMIGAGMEFKTLFETTAGWAPETTRTGRVVLDAQRPIQVIDAIPNGRISQAAEVYMEETTFTNNAAEAAEGAQFGEAALAYTERSNSVRKIAVFLPVTDEQLEDEAGIASLLDNRLGFMVRQRLDLQLLVGDGIAPNLIGFNNVSGIQTQAKGADSVPDAVYKGMTKIRVTGQAVPSAYITHPNDWQGVRLLTTTDGIYLWGSPSEAGPERIWGLPVVQAQAQTENTGLVGDYAAHTQFSLKKGVTVKISDSHSDYFIKGKLAIRAELRGVLTTYRPEAICTITGI